MTSRARRSPNTSAASESSCSSRPIVPSRELSRSSRPQLVLAVRLAAGLGGGRHAERLEHEVAEPVQPVDERLRRVVEDPHRRRQREHDRRRARDRGALRRELADDDVQRRDERERKRRGEADAGDLGRVAEQRLERVVERRLAERAEPQRADRDAELARREVAVDVIDRVQHGLRPRPALVRELLGLRVAQARDAELDGDEEAVEADEDQREDDAGGGHGRGVPVRLAARPRPAQTATSAGLGVRQARRAGSPGPCRCRR